MGELGFWGGYVWPTVLIALKVLAIVLPLLIFTAFLSLAERKVMAAMQLRLGPNVVGPVGVWQAFADAFKMMLKETILPTRANKVVFLAAPLITFVLATLGWAVIPFDVGVVLADINVGILFLLAVSSLSVYGIIMAGWASNSRYPFLGALRSAAQMVSYEVSMGFVIITVLLVVGSLNLSDIVKAQETIWFFIPLFPMFIIFFVSTLAETNRHPFDLPEAEAELVAGYQVEYSAMTFGLFFIGELVAMVLMSAMTAILFLGGWLAPFGVEPFTWIPGFIWFLLKIVLVLFVFIWVKATLPRYRYDQLMRLGWKVFLPFSLLWVAITAGALIVFGWLPGT